MSSSTGWFSRLFFNEKKDLRRAGGHVPTHLRSSVRSPDPIPVARTEVAVRETSKALATQNDNIIDRENNVNPVLFKVGNVKSVIAADVELNGDLILKDAGVRIQGVINGNISQQGNSLVLIDKDAKITGEIRARYLIVLGQVNGPIYAEKVVAGASALIEGDVHYRYTYQPMPGTKFRGRLMQQDEPIFPVGQVVSMPPSETRKLEPRVVSSVSARSTNT